MKKLKLYCLLALAFAAIAAGSVIAAFRDVFPEMGYTVLWGVVPVGAVFLAVAALNLEVVVPRLLMRNRYWAYIIFTFLTVYPVPMVCWWVEYLCREHLGLPQRITGCLSPWIPVDSLLNSILLFFIILGLGLYAVSFQWRSQVRREVSSARMLGRYIARVKEWLDPDGILREIDAILSDLGWDASAANRHIFDFCASLRMKLYSNPMPDVPPDNAATSLRHPSLVRFLTARRYRAVRLAAVFLMLLAISLETLFEAPDRPVLSSGNLMGSAALLLFLAAITAITVKFVFVRFSRHGSPRTLVRDIALLIVALTGPFVLLQLLSYQYSPYSGVFPWPVAALATLASTVSLLLFLAGISTLALIQRWLSGERRMALLRAETARQEYLFLRKQINPHFLFNVLNNIGILTSESTGEARQMLLQLRRLLVYQFSDGGSSSVTVEKEMEFIASYLALQRSRMSNFDFDMHTDENAAGVAVPSLIFITFVENAVKHSAPAGGMRRMGLRVTAEKGGVRFICRNTCAAETRPAAYGSTEAGGLGLQNTRRRLALLYADRYSLDITRAGNLFIVNLFIPSV